nr:MAG TPA: hypothetical protein [Caudoviricetes sp.]
MAVTSDQYRAIPGRTTDRRYRQFHARPAGLCALCVPVGRGWHRTGACHRAATVAG